MTVRINQRLAKEFISRAKTQGYTGKRRDAAAIEFFCGAAAALHGDPTQQTVLIAAMLVSARGYSEVERLATNTIDARHLVA